MATNKVKVKVTSGDEDLGIKQNDFIILRKKNKEEKIYFKEVEGFFEISDYRWEPPGNAVLSFYDKDNNAAFTIEIECNEQINEQILGLKKTPDIKAADPDGAPITVKEKRRALLYPFVIVAILMAIFFSVYSLGLHGDDKKAYDILVEVSASFKDPSSVRLVSGSYNGSILYCCISAKNSYGARVNSYYRVSQYTGMAETSYPDEKYMDKDSLNINKINKELAKTLSLD